MDNLIRELHAINYFSLSFSKRPHWGNNMEAGTRARMDTPNMSTAHRKALEYKLTVDVLMKMRAPV